MENAKGGIEWSAMIITILICISVMCVIYFISDSLYKDQDKYYLKEGDAVFVETKSLLGSIFHKDIITLTNENIIIKSHSFFGTKSTIFPYNTLREVSFSKWFNGYKLVIKYPGNLFGTNSTTLYFNQKYTFNILNSQFHIKSNNRCIITESF